LISFPAQVYALLIPAFILARSPRRSRCSGAAASTLRFPTMRWTSMGTH